MPALVSLMLILAACGEADSTEAAAPAAAPAAEAPAAEAPAAAPAALEGEVYGEGVSLTESTPVSALLGEIDRYNGQKVRVEGVVTEVCEKRGCWMNIAGDQPFQTMRFKVQDGVITIPIEARGKYAVAEGVCRKVDLSPEDALAIREHEAEEQGKPVDPNEPLPTYIVKLEGTGAVIRDRM